MKLAILYHPKSEFSRLAEEYAHDFEHQKGTKIELISLETQIGAELAKLYGIVQYPALFVSREGGDLVKHWEGAPLPLMNEVAGYLV